MADPASATRLGGAAAERAESARLVHDALAHLYDPGHLQTHPLAAACGGGRALRGALLDAVEALKPPREGKPGPRSRRRYELLRLRYVEGMPVEEVQRQLLIGRSEYYREHTEAVEAVASLLRECGGPANDAAARPQDAAHPPDGREPPPAGVPSSGRLPVPLTSFVGRDGELAETERVLRSTRLLTLTGPGGCGKTRLALHAAARLTGEYPDGVYLAELAPLTDPALVPGAVAAAAGVREAPGRPVVETLVRLLGDKRLLLVLDNCEHVIEACAGLAQAVLQSCPGVRVLATSREPLRAAGEVSWRVQPLPVPSAESRLPGYSADQVSSYASVRLFADRAAAVLPGFAVTEQTHRAVAEICRRLDGLPLALELAAAWVRVLSAEQIAARLDDRFRLLTGGSRTALAHQQTLRATLDWSHGLLSETEQVLFRRLAAFAGGWTIEAAESVCAGQGIAADEILGLLAGLVDKSLVVAEDDGGEERYRFLETIRAYGLERLGEQDAADPVRQQHAAHFLALAERAEPELVGPNAPAWLDRLEREHDNLRAAHRWYAETNQTEPGLRLVGALGMFWYFRGHRSEARARFEELLAQPAVAPSTVGRARALFWAGWLESVGGGAEDSGRQRCAESLAMARALDDQQTVARALVALGAMANWPGARPAAARLLIVEGLALGRRLGDGWSVSDSLLYLGVVSEQEGDHAAARAALGESLAFARAVGNRSNTAATLEHLGNVALAEGAAAEAEAFYRAALATFREFGDLPGVAHALQGMG